MKPWHWILIIIGIAAAISFSLTNFLHDRKMLATFHLLIPLTVIGIEVYIVFQAEHERRERQELIAGLDAFRISLGRPHYMQDIERAIIGAETDIVFTTATMATSNDPDQKRLLKAVLRREKETDRPYLHRGLASDETRTLPGALELLCKTKVEIRMSSFVGLSRLRFLIRDSSLSVIGIAANPSTVSSIQPTDRSFSIESRFLAESLHKRFDDEWALARKPGDVLAEMINSHRQSNEKLTRADILSLLGVSLDEDTLGKHCQAFKDLPPAIDEKVQAR